MKCPKGDGCVRLGLGRPQLGSRHPPLCASEVCRGEGGQSRPQPALLGAAAGEQWERRAEMLAAWLGKGKKAGALGLPPLAQGKPLPHKRCPHAKPQSSY